RRAALRIRPRQAAARREDRRPFRRCPRAQAGAARSPRARRGGTATKRRAGPRARARDDRRLPARHRPAVTESHGARAGMQGVRIASAAEIGGAARLEGVWLRAFGAGDRALGWFARKLARERVTDELSQVAIATDGDP